MNRSTGQSSSGTSPGTGGGALARLGRRLFIPISHASAGRPVGAMRRLRSGPGRIPTHGRIVLRVHATALR